MSEHDQAPPEVNRIGNNGGPPILDPADLIWGADAIARAIGVRPRQAFYMLEAGQLPARKVGGRWVSSRSRLRVHLLGEGGASQ